MQKFSFSVWIVLGTLLGIAVGTATSFLLHPEYESKAELQVVPSQVPERFVGTVSAPPIQQSLKPMIAVLLSRGMLANIIQSYDLYPQERGRLPMEDVILTMRDYVRIWTQTEGQHTTIHVSFRYRDRVLAQRIATDIAVRLVDEFYRSQKTYQQMTVQFLRDMLDTASREWTALKQGKGVAADRSELRALDIECARRQYESVRQKLSEAEVLYTLINRRMGETLELSEPASLPEKPAAPRRETFIAGGALGGLIAALAIVLAKTKLSSRKPPSSELTT